MAPTRFGRYEVRRVLGRGGMGVVYEGHDPQIDRPVAIKTIALDALNADEAAEFEARFRAEMRSTGRLQHQNIVALYDTGRDEGTAYIVMELVPGQDLKQRLAGGQRFDLAQAVDIGLQLLSALAYAHARQVIHRDIKPANVMLQKDGRVKLCDFGVARLTDADATRTRGLVVGTVRYASPEQIAGLPIDARTDLYSAAVLLYELLAGKPPFDGQSDVETLHRISQQPPQAPSALNAAVPAALDAVLLRALSKSPTQRFDSATDFAAALRTAMGLSADPTVPFDATQPLRRPAPQRRRWWIGAAALLPLALMGAWWARPGPAVESAPVVAAPASAAASPPSPPSQPVAASAAAPASAAPVVAVADPKPAPKPLPPKPAPAPAPLKLDGSWLGLYGCGETIGPRSPGVNSEAFSAKIALDVQGTRISWTRSGKTWAETVIGSIDGRGRFTAEGEGWDDAEGRKNRWWVQASGSYNTRVQPARLEGQVELLRAKDRSVARRCTLSAVPR